jgi:hypothetical protein
MHGCIDSVVAVVWIDTRFRVDLCWFYMDFLAIMNAVRGG